MEVFQLKYGPHTLYCKSMQIGLGVGGAILLLIAFIIIIWRKCNCNSHNETKSKSVPSGRYPNMMVAEFGKDYYNEETFRNESIASGEHSAVSG